MKYTITPEQLLKIIKTYIGPLKQSKGKWFKTWKNKDGIVVFMTSKGNDLVINESIFNSLKNFLNIERNTEELRSFMNVFFNYLDDVVGVKVTGLIIKPI